MNSLLPFIVVSNFVLTYCISDVWRNGVPFLSGTTSIPPQSNLMFPNALSGRGSTTFLTCGTAAGTTPTSCNIYSSEYVKGHVVWSLQSILVPSDRNSYFGDVMQNVAALSGNYAFIGAPAAVGSATTSGSVYVFEGNRYMWSEQQRLSARDTKPNVGTDFGTTVAATEGADYLLIGAPSDDDKAVLSGSVYSFKLHTISSRRLDQNPPVPSHILTRPLPPLPPSPTMKIWSQQQKLVIKEGIPNIMFGFSSSVYGTTAVIGAPGVQGGYVTGGYVGAAYVFSLNTALCSWSQQQKISPPSSVTGSGGFATFMSMYGKYLAIAYSTQDFVSGGVTTQGAGAVYIYKIVSSSKGTFRVSLMSTLVQPDAPLPGDNFGSSLSLYGTTLFIGGQQSFTSPGSGSGKIYVYNTNGKSWTLETELVDPTGATGVQFVNPTVLGMTAFVTDSQPNAYYYAADGNWSCLIVSVGDQFGDGWDKAKLVITAPDGTTDTFAPYCNSRNPFVFRYCPLLPTDNGVYTLSVPRAPDSKFFWEIYWNVAIQYTNEVFRGDHGTQMTFVFNGTTGAFAFVSGVNIQTNTTCKVCPGKPSPKPTPEHLKPLKPDAAVPKAVKVPGSVTGVQAAPKLFRKLQQSTPTPTSVPTQWPTLNSSAYDDWQWIKLYDSTADGWFVPDGSGTSYYISDTEGNHLITSGTLCDDMISYQCWVPLKDGTYVLRVGGGLTIDSGDHTWSFCGKTGGAQQQLVFTIADGECEPLMTFSKNQYCVTGGRINLKGKLLLKGMDNDTDLTSGDELVLDQLISYFVKILDASDVSINSVAFNGQLDGHVVTFTATVPEKAGYDFHSYDSVSSLRSYFYNALETAAEDGKLDLAMQSFSDMSTKDSNVLTDVRNIRLLDLYVSDIQVDKSDGKDSHLQQSAPVELTSSESASHSDGRSSSISSEAVAIYASVSIAIALTLLAALVLFVANRRSSAKGDLDTSSSIELMGDHSSSGLEDDKKTQRNENLISTSTVVEDSFVQPLVHRSVPAVNEWTPAASWVPVINVSFILILHRFEGMNFTSVRHRVMFTFALVLFPAILLITLPV